MFETPAACQGPCWDVKTHQAPSLSRGCPEHGSEARQTGASARRGTDAMRGEDRVEARCQENSSLVLVTHTGMS